MGKRFTDTSKWRDEWFRALTPHAKLIWLYLCDDCDHAGVWIEDFEVMSLRTGVKVDENRMAEMLGSKVIRFDKNRFFIPSFFKVQYANAKEGFKAKQSALAVLQKLGLVDTTGTVIEVSGDTSEQSQDCHIISKSIIKGKGNTGDARGAADIASPADFEAAYQAYPKKVGKSAGLAKLKKQCPTKTELADFVEAMAKYVADCKKNDVFLKQFDTFVNSPWRDWLDPDAGDTSGPGKSATVDFRKIAEGTT